MHLSVSTGRLTLQTTVVKYETSIKAGKFVLVAHGTAAKMGKAATC
jgi:hypothetical protein